MYTTHGVRSLLSTFLLSCLLVFVLAACGSNPDTAPKSGSTYGCPSSAAITSPSLAANVVVNSSKSNSIIIAHNGDVVEFRLPFGQRWLGPTTSESVLELQQPYGYAVQSDQTCVWRFIARATGTVELNFQSQALCKAGEQCPLSIVNVPFTIEVK